jgi:XTP/dITP diphosphohydrolase
MKTVTYITGNPKKYANAVSFFKSYPIELLQQKIDLDEIQSNRAEEIAIKKARDAFLSVGEPLFINDASWHIPALNGFPGPYMRYMLDWFTIDDFLRLMEVKEDRTIILRDTIVYKDESTEKVFTNDVRGRLLTSATAGDGPYITKLITFNEDETSLAESPSVGFTEPEMKLWEEFAEWLVR